MSGWIYESNGIGSAVSNESLLFERPKGGNIVTTRNSMETYLQRMRLNDSSSLVLAKS